MSSAVLLFLGLFSLCYAWTPMKVGSWNTMLQPWMLWSEEVFEHMPGDLDVLALQEVWTTAARDAILRKTKHKYPFHYWPKQYNENVGCDMSDPAIAYLSYLYLQCLETNGIDTQTVQQPLKFVPIECMQYAIGIGIHNYDPRNQLCLACLINGLEYLPHADAGNVLGMCGEGVGPKFGHKGVNGQLILSKYPIEKVVEHRLDAFVVNRMNIHATINGIKFGFGHFAYNLLLDAAPELGPLMYGALQVNHVQDFVDAGVDVVVGDFNSGPEYQPDGFNLLKASGYHQVSPNIPTWCNLAHANFLPCINAVSVPYQIDHIFVRDSAPILSWHPATFNTKPIEMSDHIGVSAYVFCWWCF